MTFKALKLNILEHLLNHVELLTTMGTAMFGSGEAAGSRGHMISNFFIKVVLNVMIYTYLESLYYKLFKYVYIIIFSTTCMKKLSNLVIT